MASYTSRIFLTLAIPSVFGLLSILFFKRKKITFVGDTVVENEELHSSSIPCNLNNNSKLNNRENIYSNKMQLKEKESSEHSSNSNGISHANQLDIQNSETHLEKEVSGFTKEVSRQNKKNCQLRDVQTNTVKENDISNGVKNNHIQKNGNGIIKFEEQILNSDKSVYINGVKRKTKNSLSAANVTVSNDNSENNQRLQNGNGMQASTSNGISHSRKSKSKKKNKDKQRENKSSCWEEPRQNGCKKDNTPLLNKDNTDELSNGVATLTVNDEAPSLKDSKEACCTNSKEMSANSCVTVGQVISTKTTVVSSTEPSSIENSLSNTKSVVSEETKLVKDVRNDNAKECDSVDHLNYNNPPCASPESGRSSNSGDIVDNGQTDINEPLTFSVDLVASGPLEDTMLDSPDVAYCDSLGSNDSGRGGSDILGYEPHPSKVSYVFDIPSQHCGFLIGKRGSHVNFIKERTNASVWIRPYPFNKDKKIVSVTGEEESEIQAAVDLIRKRFPLKDYPDLTLEPSSLSHAEVICPPSLKLSLPEGTGFQVVLSATINAGHFFIQLPTHPSYHALLPFTLSMTSLYSHCDSPAIANVAPGNIVASKVGGGWFRAEIVEVYPEEDACNIKYLDYGGYQIVPRGDLRQINIEFMQMPFQATECYLSHVTPHEELGWTEESKMAFESLAHGQILSAIVTGIADDGIPCLYLYQITGATNTFINQALVEAGLLRWITYDQ